MSCPDQSINFGGYGGGGYSLVNEDQAIVYDNESGLSINNGSQSINFGGGPSRDGSPGPDGCYTPLISGSAILYPPNYMPPGNPHSTILYTLIILGILAIIIIIGIAIVIFAFYRQDDNNGDDNNDNGYVLTLFVLYIISVFGLFVIMILISIMYYRDRGTKRRLRHNYCMLSKKYRKCINGD